MARIRLIGACRSMIATSGTRHRTPQTRYAGEFCEEQSVEPPPAGKSCLFLLRINFIDPTATGKDGVVGCACAFMLCCEQWCRAAMHCRETGSASYQYAQKSYRLAVCSKGSVYCLPVYTRANDRVHYVCLYFAVLRACAVCSTSLDLH